MSPERQSIDAWLPCFQEEVAELRAEIGRWSDQALELVRLLEEERRRTAELRQALAQARQARHLPRPWRPRRPRPAPAWDDCEEFTPFLVD